MATKEGSAQTGVPDGVSCPSCRMQFQRRDLYKHSAACPKRQYTCDFCNFGSTYDVILNHWQNECNRYPVPCPYNCRPEPFERQDLEEHEKECPQLARVDCEYTGCKCRPLCKDMQLHLKENVAEHLALVAANQSKEIDDLRQVNSGIELNYQELQMTALKRKQDEHQGRLERTERTLGDVDYKASCKIPQQIQKLQEKSAKLEQKQEEVQNTASYQGILANQKVVQVKEEVNAANAQTEREMAQLGQQLVESTTVQQQQVAELRQQVQENSRSVEEQVIELKREDQTIRGRMTQDKDELMATLGRENQALKDELIARHTQENQALVDRLDAISRENRTMRDEGQSSIATLNQRIRELTRDLYQAKESAKTQMLEMQQLLDRKIVQLRREHDQDLSLIRRSMISSIKMPCEQTMTNFEERKLSNSPWYSEPFTTSSLDYKFCLVVFANGSGPNEGTHVSIYAHLMEGSTSETIWPAGGEVVVTLLNQLGDRGGIRVNIPLSCEVPNTRRIPARGIDLISHQKLRNHTADVAYLQNDQLRLHISDFRTANAAGVSKRGGGWFWS